MFMLYLSCTARSDVKLPHRTLDSSKSGDCATRESLFPGVFLSGLAALFTSGTISVSAATGISPALAQISAASQPSAQIFGLPMQFEKNAGQTDRQVEFLARGPGYTLFLTPTQAVFSLSSRKNSATDEKRAGRHDGRRSGGDPITLAMDLLGANPHPPVEGLDELPGKASYFIGSKPENWHVGVPTFAKVKYHQIYPGIDLLYYGNQRQLEYDFIVAPKADAKRIALKIDGADQFELNSQGDLVAHLNGTKVSWHRPFAFQETQAGRKEIPSRFTLKKNRRVGFEVASYDHTKPLIIDPALVYATYLGGTGDEISFYSFAPNGVKIALDTNGNVFVAGQTLSRNFPTRNAYDSTANGADTNLCDVFVTKFNASGNALIYSTYLGGVSNDVAGGIAVDSSGNAYITGSTESPDFPHVNAVQSANNGYDDIFVTRLSSNGTSIVYSTFLGGGNDDFGRAIAVDSSGSAYITGKSWSKGTGNSPFLTTHGAFQADNGGGYANNSEGGA